MDIKKEADFFVALTKETESLKNRDPHTFQHRNVKFSIPELSEKEKQIRSNGFQLGAMWARDYLLQIKRIKHPDK